MIGIEVDSLNFSFPSGIVALRDVTLQIHAREAIAIVGQNGAGKTTLAKHLNGLLKPASGSVRVGDWDTQERSVAQLASRVGYVFQNPDDQLFQQTVRSEVMFGPRNLGWGLERIQTQVERSLEMVGLSAVADKHPYDLSYSERKLVALASVLAMDTPAIVLDEPTTGQDYSGVTLIGKVVDTLREQGKTVITITHDIDFCAEHFERVAVMLDGRILLDGPARHVLAQADVLSKTYVEPPQIIRLALGLGFGQVPLSVDEFIAALP